MSRFSELTRIEAAIKNKSAKELEWSSWYCRMRQTIPSALPSHVKYWRGVEEMVLAAMAPVAQEKKYAARKKRAGRGLGLSGTEEKT
jgi:hypothetical protein